MIIAPFKSDRSYDEFLEKIMVKVDDALTKADDDFLLICAGGPGTGKTRLMFHGYDKFAGSLSSIDQVALNQRDFALVLDRARHLPTKRFAGYDEANVNKRNALTTWNKKLIDLYLNIRGLNIFHWWNNPSLEMLDKPFIEERVKGVVFILTKSRTKPRLYLYFTKDGILDLLEEHGNLKSRTIQKHGMKYAYYLGWFKDYVGPLLGAYHAMKTDRMHQKVSDFTQEFAPSERWSVTAVAKKLGVANNTAMTMIRYGIEAKELVQGEHYLMLGSGNIQLLATGLEVVTSIAENQRYRKRPSQPRRTLNMLTARALVHTIH